MRNEMRSWLKELHRVVQRSCFFLARDQRSLRLLEAEVPRRMLSSQITDELKILAHPVGISIYVLRENWGRGAHLLLE